MSVRGIDVQMMITRLSDNIREASAAQKRPETVQDVLAFKEKINTAAAQERVAKTTESDMEKVRVDVYEGGGGGGGDDSERDGDEKDEEDETELVVPPGDNIIDILV